MTVSGFVASFVFDHFFVVVVVPHFRLKIIIMRLFENLSVEGTVKQGILIMRTVLFKDETRNSKQQRIIKWIKNKRKTLFTRVNKCERKRDEQQKKTF